MSTDLEAAWSDLHDAKPPGWFVGRAVCHDRYHAWKQYAFDPSEKAWVGVRSREWAAVAATEVEVIRELARCLREIREARVPEQWQPTGRQGIPKVTPPSSSVKLMVYPGSRDPIFTV